MDDKIIKELTGCLLALGHPTRLRITEYCVQPRSHSSLMFDLRLNPNTFRFHVSILIKHDILKKVRRGQYETTARGKLLLEYISKVKELMKV